MFKSSALKIADLDETGTSGTGVREWLLLYRPEGSGAWIVQILFYFCLLSALVLKVRGVMAAVGALHNSSPWLAFIYFTSASLFVLVTLYLRGVSQRLTAIGKDSRKQNQDALR
jgi:hypothetical protein